MREILFRGKRIDNGEWVYGSLLNDATLDPSDNSRYSIWSNDGDGVWNDVIPETIGQFTGLTDKNGEDVYEGDVITSEQWNPSEYEVIFWGGEFCFVSLQRVEKPYNNPIHYVEHFIVKGNIHDTL